MVGPDKKIKLMLSYPMSTGRNFDEVLRVLDSMQLTAKHEVATPVNWKPGEDVIILPSVSDEEAKKKYPAGWKAAPALSADCSAAGVGIKPKREPTMAEGGEQPARAVGSAANSSPSMCAIGMSSTGFGSKAADVLGASFFADSSKSRTSLFIYRLHQRSNSI